MTELNLQPISYVLGNEVEAENSNPLNMWLVFQATGPHPETI